MTHNALHPGPHDLATHPFNPIYGETKSNHSYKKPTWSALHPAQGPAMLPQCWSQMFKSQNAKFYFFRLMFGKYITQVLSVSTSK